MSNNAPILIVIVLIGSIAAILNIMNYNKMDEISKLIKEQNKQ